MPSLFWRLRGIIMKVTYMKKLVLVLASLLISFPLLLTACSNPGPSETKQYNFADFTGVQAGGAFDVVITPLSTYSVSISAPQNWFKHMTIKKSGSTLEVGMNFGFWDFWRNLGSKPKLEVSMPELDNLNLSGASTGTARGFTTTKNFQLELSGASSADVDIGAYDTSIAVTGASHATGILNINDLTLDVSGASNITLSGTGNNLNLKVYGASGADLGNLQVKDAMVELRGASHGTVDTSGKLDINASGASSLSYVGNPTIGTIDVTGASSIHQK
jgi:hypothetical protein